MVTSWGIRRAQRAVDAAAQRVVDEKQNKTDISRELGRMPGHHDAFRTADKNIKNAKKDLKKAEKKLDKKQR
ncbi:hypothetical protein OHA18_11940 [Kribbella sp. NBC_00709]|uniref:hypothetical protein n=1 Tax=Kribbella sp. NBC_00709 TaxID=2975972 RepID=UPI002E27C33C|nr:hypothetical protein [Kribbella sp. NBC_00709]